MEEASMRFLLSIFCQSFTQAGFYYLMSLVVIHLSLAPYAFQSVTSSVGSLLPATEHE